MTDANRWGASPEEWTHFSFWLGLTADLLPVVSNPHAVVSKTSKLKSLGKTPSKYNGAREVVGVHQWTAKVGTDAMVDLWSREPDYGLCVQTRRVRAIDVDLEQPGLVAEVVGFFTERLGPCPIRFREGSSRVLLAYAIEGALEKRALKARDGAGIVEFLADGQQFVALGAHSNSSGYSGTRYAWAGGLPDTFPSVDLETFEAAWVEAMLLFADPAWLLEHPAGGRKHVLSLEGAREHVLQGQADPVVSWLERQGWVRETHGSRIFVWCPWREGHSGDSGPTEAEWFVAGTGGYEVGHFKCLHASCLGRTREAFLEEIGFAHAIEGDFDVVGGEEPDDASTTPPARLNGAAVSTRLSSVSLWRSSVPGEGLRRTKKGFVASIDNLCKALDTEGFWCRLGYDTFRCEIMRSTWNQGRWGAESGGWAPWTDNDYGRAKRELENAGFEPVPAELVRMAVGLVADERQFDSAQLWLGGLGEWDGVPRVETFFSAYMGVADGAYSRACGRYLWTALAGRVLQPGVKADMVPILVGPQGFLKSTGLECLAPGPEWAVGVDLGKQDADLARRVRGRLVVVLSELRGLRSKEMEAILDWVTQTYDVWVPKYKEYGVQNPRRFVLVGCCNPRGVGFLDDVAGNRRWLPMTVERPVALDRIAADREQLWAEGAVLFGLGGVDWRDAERLAKEEHAAYEVEDSWEPMVETWLKKPRPADYDVLPGESWGSGGFKLRDALIEGCGLDPRQCNKATDTKVANLLRKFKFDIRNVKFEGVGFKRWWLPGVTPSYLKEVTKKVE